jgi:hypothetical protein
MINRVPSPPLLAFIPNKAPHLIDLGWLTLPKDTVHLFRITSLE